MSAEFDALKAQVAANTSVVESAKALLAGLAAKIDALVAAGADPAAFTALAAQLKGDDDALAAAVAANTGKAS